MENIDIIKDVLGNWAKDEKLDNFTVPQKYSYGMLRRLVEKTIQRDNNHIRIKALREQIKSWENIFFNIKINSKGEWADATYYLLLEEKINKLEGKNG